MDAGLEEAFLFWHVERSIQPASCTFGIVIARDKTVLIGDVGSTSADWALLNGDTAHQFSTRGFNPTAHDAAELAQMLTDVGAAIGVDAQPTSLWYYGTGVNNQTSREVVLSGFFSIESLKDLSIESDILGAARALCQGDQGVVAILGTGSNACSYAEHQIKHKAINLGYLLADEGSGFDIGRRLATAFYYGKLPNTLSNKMADEFPRDPGEMVKTLYAHHAPNRYLASFARFAIENRELEEMKSLVKSSFQSFIHSHKIIYESSQKIHFVGSIAYYFCDVLAEELAALGLQLGSVVQKPIDLLIKYHQQF